MNVSVVGAGYVGLVTGACLPAGGHRVTVVEQSEPRLEMLRSSGCPIHEPGLQELLQRYVSEGKLSFEGAGGSFAGADVIVVAVGTPSAANGEADLSQVRAAMAAIIETAIPGAVVVMKSTVPVGTGVALQRELSGHGIGYASNPEFLREGSAVGDWFHTDRIVVGAAGEHARERAHELYRGIDAPFVDCDIASAEMIKYASNAFLATKISFVNEIANVCELVGADVTEVARGMGLDARIGSQFLKAGLGYGGSCFPKDTRALQAMALAGGYEFGLLRGVMAVNDNQRARAVEAVRAHVGDLRGQRVAVLGITFKSNTDDTRESPALEVIALLAAAGVDVAAHDPVGTLPEGVAAQQCESAIAALDGASAAIVAVEWPEYASIDWITAASRMTRGALVFDGRNCVDASAVLAAGLAYRGVGRPLEHLTEAPDA